MSQVAQEVGLICREFGYRFEDVLEMPVSKLRFLLAWLDWYYRQVKR
ncbi:MAG: hypothetical protein QW334_00085 [Thermofilum sp.]